MGTNFPGSETKVGKVVRVKVKTQVKPCWGGKWGVGGVLMPLCNTWHSISGSIFPGILGRPITWRLSTLEGNRADT